MATVTPEQREQAKGKMGRMFVNTWHEAVASGRREKEYCGTIIPSLRDKPFLLCGLLALYCLHKQYFAHDFSQDSDSAVAQVGFMAFVLALMTVAAVADAIAEVEVEVRAQERLRLK